MISRTCKCPERYNKGTWIISDENGLEYYLCEKEAKNLLHHKGFKLISSPRELSKLEKLKEQKEIPF